MLRFLKPRVKCAPNGGFRVRFASSAASSAPHGSCTIQAPLPAELPVWRWMRTVGESVTVKSMYKRTGSPKQVRGASEVTFIKDGLDRLPKMGAASTGGLERYDAVYALMQMSSRYPAIARIGSTEFERLTETKLPAGELWLASPPLHREVNSDEPDPASVVGVAALEYYWKPQSAASSQPTYHMQHATVFCPTMPVEAVRSLAQHWGGSTSGWNRLSAERLMTAYDTPLAAARSGIPQRCRSVYDSSCFKDGLLFTYDTNLEGSTHILSASDIVIVSSLILPQHRLVLERSILASFPDPISDDDRLMVRRQIGDDLASTFITSLKIIE